MDRITSGDLAERLKHTPTDALPVLWSQARDAAEYYPNDREFLLRVADEIRDELLRRKSASEK